MINDGVQLIRKSKVLPMRGLERVIACARKHKKLVEETRRHAAKRRSSVQRTPRLLLATLSFSLLDDSKISQRRSRRPNDMQAPESP